MSARLESAEEKDFVDDVKHRLRIDSLKLNLMGNKGWPDRLFLLPLRPALIEFKRIGEEPYLLQFHRIGVLYTLGYDVAWTSNYGAAYDFLEDLLTTRLSEAGYTFDDWTSLCRTFT